MTTVTRTRASVEMTRIVNVALDDAPSLDYHLSGRLVPHNGYVKASTYNGTTSYVVSLTAQNANGIHIGGTWGWPEATSIPNYEYGHGGEGLITDLPASLLEALSDTTGIDLTHLTVE